MFVVTQIVRVVCNCLVLASPTIAEITVSIETTFSTKRTKYSTVSSFLGERADGCAERCVDREAELDIYVADFLRLAPVKMGEH